MIQNEIKLINKEDKEAVDILVREIVKAINEKNNQLWPHFQNCCPPSNS